MHCLVLRSVGGDDADGDDDDDEARTESGYSYCAEAYAFIRLSS